MKPKEERKNNVKMKILHNAYYLILIIGGYLISCNGFICLQISNDDNLFGYYKTDYIPDISHHYSDLKLNLDSTYEFRILVIKYQPLDTLVKNYYTGKWTQKGNVLILTHTKMLLNYVDSINTIISDTTVNFKNNDNVLHKFKIIQKNKMCTINCIEQLLFRKVYSK